MATNADRIGRYLSGSMAKSAQLELPASQPRAAEIAGEAAPAVVALLRQAFAAEWLAYYQYWLGAKVARGCMRASIADELEAHAAEEFAHAGQVADRIVDLGGVPTMSPADWNAVSPCKFACPDDRSVEALVEQNIEAERCAIDLYKRILDATREADEVTYDMAVKILADEQQHETDLRKFRADLRS